MLKRSFDLDGWWYVERYTRIYRTVKHLVLYLQKYMSSK